MVDILERFPPIMLSFVFKFWYSKSCFLENSWCQRTTWLNTRGITIPRFSRQSSDLISYDEELRCTDFSPSVFSFLCTIWRQPWAPNAWNTYYTSLLMQTPDIMPNQGPASLLWSTLWVTEGRRLGQMTSGKDGVPENFRGMAEFLPLKSQNSYVDASELGDGCSVKLSYLDCVARAQ